MTKRSKSQARKIPSYVQAALAARNLEAIRSATSSGPPQPSVRPGISTPPAIAPNESFLSPARLETNHVPPTSDAVSGPHLESNSDQDNPLAESDVVTPDLDQFSDRMEASINETVDEPSGDDDDQDQVTGDTDTIGLIESKDDISAEMRQAGMNDDQISLVYKLANEHLQPAWNELVRGLNDTVQTERDENRLIATFGSRENWDRVRERIESWSESNVPEEALDSLARSYDGVMALYRWMLPGAGTTPTGAQPYDDIGNLRSRMQDPRYWKDFNRDYRKSVREGFQRLYPESE